MSKIFKLVALEIFEKSKKLPAEMKHSFIDEVFKKYGITEDEGFRTWTIDELCKAPSGSIFQHSGMGRFVVLTRKNGTKYAYFGSGDKIDFAGDQCWKSTIKLISVEV